MPLICRFDGKVRPDRNWFQRLLDRALGRKWMLVATCDNGEAVVQWFEMRRPNQGKGKLRLNDFTLVYGDRIDAEENQ